MNVQSKTVSGSIDSSGGIIKLVRMDGQAIASVQVSGTFSGTLQFEGSLNNEDWVSIPFKNPSNGVEGSSTTSTGVFTGSVSGFKEIRVRASVLSSGEAEVIIITTFSGSVTSSRSESVSSSANTPEILTSATALALNSDRKGWMIQNTGTNPLFVRLAASASSTVFHAVLKGGTGDSDGLGDSLSQMDGGVIYTGIITIAGTSPKYVVTEL